jgi:prophage regulatory protein
MLLTRADRFRYDFATVSLLRTELEKPAIERAFCFGSRRAMPFPWCPAPGCNSHPSQVSMQTVASALPAEGFVRLPQLLKVIPLSTSSLYRHVRAGKFPAPKKIGLRAVAWDVRAVRAYLEAAR